MRRIAFKSLISEIASSWPDVCVHQLILLVSYLARGAGRIGKECARLADVEPPQRLLALRSFNKVHQFDRLITTLLLLQLQVCITIECLHIVNDFQRWHDALPSWLILERLSQLLAIFGVLVLPMAKEPVRYYVVVLDSSVCVSRIRVMIIQSERGIYAATITEERVPCFLFEVAVVDEAAELDEIRR